MLKAFFKDNRGLTLVELLCGVVILAIVVVPLLHTFLVGASTEAKSRRYGEVTEAAQNLSEQIQTADADLVLSNASAISAGAKYYTYNGSSYALYGTSPYTKAPDFTALPTTYYIGIPNYSYGNSSYDALIKLDLLNDSATANPANSKNVVVGNQMDASLDMTAADSAAVDALIAECGDLVANLTIKSLTRSISLNVSRTAVSSTYTYKITGVLTYTATIPYTISGKTGTYYYYFTHNEQVTASVSNIIAVPKNDSPVFSVFMFYNAYYKTNSVISDTIVINSPDEYPDINFFVINTNTADTPAGYTALLWYKYQNFTTDINPIPVNNLIFTNLPSSNNIVKYRASKDALYRKSLSVTGYLVETKQLQRKFGVSVKLFKAGSGFSGNPLIDIDSTKLNY